MNVDHVCAYCGCVDSNSYYHFWKDCDSEWYGKELCGRHYQMLRKGKAKDINDMTCKNILNIPNVKAGTKLHNCQKPTELTDVLIANSSNEGDIVMDMFLRVWKYRCICITKQ